MTEELEQLVDKAAALSSTAVSKASKELAARKRREARERCNIAIMEIGKLIAKLNAADKIQVMYGAKGPI
jgi:hypothetical protein